MREASDRGSVSLWVVIFAFTTLALLVLVVDGGQAMNAKSRAADIAEQAARAAADDVNVGDLRAGTVATRRRRVRPAARARRRSWWPTTRPGCLARPPR